MNLKDMLLLITALWISFDFVKSECGKQHLIVNETNRQHRFHYHVTGSTKSEQCHWKFDYKGNEEVVLVLIIKRLSFHVKTLPTYFTLPNGTRIKSSNAANYTNKCMVFRKKQSNQCLKYAYDDHCDATIVDAKQWPPVLSSSSESSRKNNKRVSLLKLNFFYRFVNCTKSSGRKNLLNLEANENCYFTATVVLSCLLAITFLVASFSVFLLCKRSRNKSKIEQSESLRRIKEPQVEYSDSDFSNSKKNAVTVTPGNNYTKVQKKNITKKNEGVVILMKQDVEFNESISKKKEIDFTANSYPRMGGSQLILEEENPENIYADISNKQIVENEIYDSYSRA